MSEFIPLFPLSLVVFPGESLRLHIFEPRYRQLLRECEETGITFGIPTVIERKLSGLATEVKLLSVDKRYANGEMDITTEGIRRAKVVAFEEKLQDRLYPGGEVEWLEEIWDSDEDLKSELYDYLNQLHEALGIQRQLINSPEEIVSFNLAHQVGFNLQQEVNLLKINHEGERLQFILAHLKEVIPVVRETERLKARAKLNGHYKNVLPPKY
jgi:Lon protease-like protein